MKVLLSKLNLDDDEITCPAATVDILSASRLDPTLYKKEKIVVHTKEKSSPKVLMRPIKTPQSRAVTPEEFHRNRRSAMKKIQSSKYQFKYNFGGKHYLFTSRVYSCMFPLW
jgi:hypothetical protein